MLPTKFQFNWSFGSGEKAKNRFSRWPPLWPSWISDQKDLAISDLQVTLMLPTKFQLNCLFVQKQKGKIDFQDGHHLEFLIRMILASFDLQVTLMLPTQFHRHSGLVGRVYALWPA